jgi:hypothetical protein
MSGVVVAHTARPRKSRLPNFSSPQLYPLQINTKYLSHRHLIIYKHKVLISQTSHYIQTQSIYFTNISLYTNTKYLSHRYLIIYKHKVFISQTSHYIQTWTIFSQTSAQLYCLHTNTKCPSHKLNIYIYECNLLSMNEFNAHYFTSQQNWCKWGIRHHIFLIV